MKEILVVMVRYPGAGQVKTRLATTLGPGLAEEIYRSFVADILPRLGRIAPRLAVAFSPAEAEGMVEEWLGEDVPLVAQNGSDLGARMENLFLHFFHKGYDSVALTGSDIPDLPGRFISESFATLATHNAVIGPAADGGYLLIGFTRNGFSPDIFRDMPWGTAHVYGKTMELLNESGRRVHVLPKWSDVDTVPDLKELYLRNRADPRDCPRTIACIEAHSKAILGQEAP